MSTDERKDDPSNGVMEEATCKEEQPQPQGEDFTHDIVREEVVSTKGKALLCESGVPSPGSGPKEFKEQCEEENRQPTRAYFLVDACLMSWTHGTFMIRRKCRYVAGLHNLLRS